MTIRIGINGFGRIGRNIYRAALKDPNIDIVAINDITDEKTLAHLLKYDSVMGNLDEVCTSCAGGITVADKTTKITAQRDPEQIPWGDMGVDVVIESTGLFSKREGASKHFNGGAKKVLISAPATDEDITIVMGVNEGNYDAPKHNIISNASCTTNCLAPVAKILLEEYGVKTGFMTTIHSYTNDQKILDLPHKDLRRSRAAALSMIPTTTGAAKAVSLVLPALKGKLDGMAVRVPTPNVSVVDLVVELEKDATAEAVNAVLKAASQGSLKGILGFTKLPLVSVDFAGNPDSSTVDGLCTKMVGPRMLKVIAWYDNEWGYSNRVLDLARYVAKQGL